MNAMSVPPEVDDSVLLHAITGGDEHALQLLINRHAPWLDARLRRRCSDPDIVATVLQDTFVAAWKGATRFRSDGQVAAWLWGIAARRLVSHLRGGKSAVSIILSDDGADSLLASAEEQALLGVEHGDLGDALRRLAPELRAVVQATILDGLTTREAARLLGVPQGTVKSRMRKAREQLRTDLILFQPMRGQS
jgi:RNA polymerase sigma-70 factor (ECF subfamily)